MTAAPRPALLWERNQRPLLKFQPEIEITKIAISKPEIRRSAAGAARLRYAVRTGEH